MNNWRAGWRLGLHTHQQEHEIGYGEAEEVVISGRVHRGVAHDYHAHNYVSNDSSQEDDHVNCC